MRIIDSLNEVSRCFENGMFSKVCWDTYIENVYPGLKPVLEDDAASYDYNVDVLPVLSAVYSEPDKIERMHKAFCNVTKGLEAKIKNTLHTEIDVDIVLYLGLCNGAGWATRINGKPTVLLGIEKILELNWTDETSIIGLIYHELGHLWHFQKRAAPIERNTLEDKALWQLYAEGVAMYCEQLLCNNPQYYHQDKNGWLQWCNDNKKRLFHEYIRRVEGSESVQDFFGDWCSFEGRSDIGYYLGAELVRKCIETHRGEEFLDLSTYEVKQLLLLCAEEN